MHSQLSSPQQPAAGKTVAAFFDLDKTIIATSSAFAFGKEFLHNGLISPATALQMSLTKASFMRSGHSDEQLNNTRDQLTSMVAGWNVDRVRTIAKDTLHSVLTPAIYAEARELIDAHRNAGHEVIIISASATVLVELIAEELGIDTVIATELEEEDGHFTGEVLFFCKGDAKAEALEELSKEYNIDLDASYSYSDSITDLPMLARVGNPVAVNPDRHLKKHALEESWEIRTFKDPEPLFVMPGAKEIGIGASVVAALAVAAGIWIAQHPNSNSA